MATARKATWAVPVQRATHTAQVSNCIAPAPPAAPRVIPTLDKVFFETGHAEVQPSSLHVLTKWRA